MTGDPRSCYIACGSYWAIMARTSTIHFFGSSSFNASPRTWYWYLRQPLTCHSTNSRNWLTASRTIPGPQASPQSSIRPPPQGTTPGLVDLRAALMNSAISCHPSHPSCTDADVHPATDGTPHPRPVLNMAPPQHAVSLALRASVGIIVPSALPPASAASLAHGRETRRPDTGGGK